MDPQRQDPEEYAEAPGDFYSDGQQSLRLRRLSSGASTRNYPQFNWGPAASEEDDEEDGESNWEDPGPDLQDLRSIPLPMALKRAVRQVQQMQVPVASKTSSWKQKKRKSLQKIKMNAKEFLSFFMLWRKSLQKIGGNFGGGVQSYFLFLRFLVVLNFVSFLLIAGFVFIPSMVFRSVGTGPLNHTGPEECMQYEPNPQGLVVFYNYFLDLLSGTGFMEYSYLFYGYYSNTLVGDTNFSYNIPLAYLFTAVFYFAFCLICIIARMGTAARVAVATGGSAVGAYSMIVFTGWDYGSLGDGATKLKQKNIHYRLQVDLEEEMMKKRAAALTLCQKVVLYSLRILMCVVAFGLIIAACAGIFQATVFSQCWETRVGQEMYKLTLFDLIVTVAVLVLVEFPRRMLVDNWSNKAAQWLGRQEFVVSANVLGLVYGQTVVWAGALFCPLLPVINTVKFVILFYCKKITLFHNCRPALRTFRSTTSTFVFLVVLLFGWAMATLVLIYSVAEIQPSMGCGPFRFFPYMWAIVPTSFHRLSKVTQEFLFFIGSQAFSIPLFALSCVVMCYFIALAAVYGRSVTLLKAQLKQEGRDKQFLVKQIEKLSRPLQMATY
ncbi:transmembrane channel-like protein 7 isoform X3 [Dunckerocampus dactyliophorus]|uniref:transmembrane channel-like protein 7 isoform X3 n=1 Tax=Dunckerocampus dactyliophorus TaxID=161453 RepID=UPI00240622D1|nr:transmembrane channel-like protein 7 isoform X3 [Dunckerocampus dactyliophorus]